MENGKGRKSVTGRKFVATRGKRSPRTRAVVPKALAPPDGISLVQAVERFIRARESQGLRNSTLREYERHADYLIEYLAEVEGVLNAKLDDLSADVLRRYIRYLLTEKRRYGGVNGRKDTSVGLSPTTVNIRLRSYRAMCNFWYAEGLAKHNAMATVKPVSTDEVEEVEGLTDEEIERLLASYDESQFADWRDKTLILLLLDTGLRPTEGAELTIDRVDFVTLTLVVPSQVSKIRKNREIPISAEIAKMVRELYEESVEYFGETEYVFNTAYGEPFTADSFRKRLNRRKERLGMSKLSPNMFRHTFCRNYLLNGGDLFTLQRIVDHANITTTRKYVQMNIEHIRHQHNRFSPAKKYTKRIR